MKVSSISLATYRNSFAGNLDRYDMMIAEMRAREAVKETNVFAQEETEPEENITAEEEQEEPEEDMLPQIPYSEFTSAEDFIQKHSVEARKEFRTHADPKPSAAAPLPRKVGNKFKEGTIIDVRV